MVLEDEVDSFIDSIIQHAATDRIYDPVKAHEYYERTKKLKGRTKRTQAQVEGWSYAQSQISTGRKTELDSAASANKAAVTQLRANAEEHRKALSKKLEDLEKSFTGDAIKEIAVLPKGLNRKEQSRRIAEIHKRVGKSHVTTRLGVRTEATKIASDLRTSLDAARAKYETLRDGIQSKYDQQTTSAKSKFGV